MTEEELRVVEIVILILGFLGVGIIPNYFYQKKIDKFNSDLNAKLTILGITFEQNHSPKMQYYENFMVSNYRVVKDKSPKAQDKLVKAIEDLSRIIFLYGSDEAINAFLVMREFEIDEEDENSKYQNLANIAKLMLVLRNDLNGGSTDTEAEIYLRILLNDWKTSQYKVKEYL